MAMKGTVFEKTPLPEKSRLGNVSRVAGGVEPDGKMPEYTSNCSGEISQQVKQNYKYRSDHAPTGETRPTRVHHDGGLVKVNGPVAKPILSDY